MVRGVRDEVLRQRCIRLRVEGRLSLREIADATGAAKGSLSAWLRPYPLTEAEVRARRSRVRYVQPKKDRGEVSKYWSEAVAGFTRAQKGKIAELAVGFRLAAQGFEIYRTMFSGDKTDWLVVVPETGKQWRIEVRWVKVDPKGGLPNISLLCRGGVGKNRRYTDDEFDFIVGYDLYSDTAYVFSNAEVSHIAVKVAVRKEAAERWDKLRL